ncbi:MAG: ROK family protein [Alphaproteobacteria bacterium]|nr:ROK family protein [Alphaproteobacteria bacterium]
MAVRYGIDLGGTKIELIALGDDGAELHRRRIPTPAGDYTATIHDIVDLVKATDTELGHAKESDLPTVGVGIPGAVSLTTGLVKNANSTCLIGKPLDRDIESGLERPVRLANDADCFALSEAMDGSGDGHAIVFGVILGTGVGGGLVINREIIRGPNAVTGEWGHNPLPWPDTPLAENLGPPCYCGRTGCIETFLSGPGLSRDANNGDDLHTFANAEDVINAARAGNVGAKAALDRYIARLSKALASAINIIDPDAIILGGGLSNVQLLYDEVPKLWGDFVFSDAVATRLLPPTHGDSSGARGAAWLWPNTD